MSRPSQPVRRSLAQSRSPPRLSAKTFERIHDRVAEKLGVAIVSGRRPPGSLLATEIEASEKLGISRPAYREAVRMLAAKGLVQSRTKTGTRVLPRSEWHLLDPDVLGWMLHDEPKPEFMQQLFELRGIIEPAAAALAALRRNSSQLERLGHALEEMAQYGLEAEKGRAADQVFHAEILGATGNETIRALTNSISASIRWTSMYTFRSSRKVRDPIPDHRRLYAAIVDGDAEAAREASLDLIRLAHEDTRLTMRFRARVKG